MSAFDPKRTLPGYPEIIPVRVHLMHLLRSLDAGRQDHLKHRHADRRPCQFVLRLPIERYSGGSAQRWPAITYLERKLRTRDRCRLRDCRPITSESDARRRRPGLRDLARSTDHAGGALRHSDNFRAARVRGGLMSYGPSLSDAYRLVGLNTRQILKGAKACGPAGPAADQVRVGDQSQDCEGAWHQRAADAARARRRGD